MIEILKMEAVGKDGNFAIMYFDFLFQNMNELPNIVYRLGNVTYVVADGSTAIHKDNHSLYKYNNRKWFKVATTTLPEIPNPDYVNSNGKHNIPNNEIHGYRTLDVNVAQGTTDYDELTNKPTINGIEVSGTLTGSDLGLQNTIVGQDGLIESQYIPPEVFERMYAVQDDTERFALTTNEVQNGDFVYVESTNLMYLVINDEHLDTEAGYKPLAAGIAAKAVGDEDGNNIKSTYVKKVDEYNAGKTVPQGTSVTIGGTTYTVSDGAEIFNDYTNNKAIGHMSHAEGASTKAIEAFSHAEGHDTIASGQQSHAEGYGSTASGVQSHAEGCNSTASGGISHAEGLQTTASGTQSHAEGCQTTASAAQSHAEGMGTLAYYDNQHVEGKYNIPDNTFAHIIGNGTDQSHRSNAFAVDWNGKIYTNNATTGVDVCTDLQSKIDSTHKLSADLVNDTSSTNKFATSAQLSQIATNQSNIDGQQNATTDTVAGRGYALINGIRIYASSTAPTGDIPDGSIGIGW